MRSIVLLLLGVPILIVILIALFSHQANVVRSIGVLADRPRTPALSRSGCFDSPIHLLLLLAVISIVIHLLTGLQTARPEIAEQMGTASAGIVATYTDRPSIC
jgi:hypothetical protein